MAQDRSETGRWVETATLEDVLGVFESVEGPVVTSADVADELDISRDSARRKLGELREQGRVDRRKTAGRVVWWLANDDDDRDIIKGFGLFEGSDLGEQVERVGEEFDRDARERERALFGN